MSAAHVVGVDLAVERMATAWNTADSLRAFFDTAPGESAMRELERALERQHVVRAPDTRPN
jgi:hypothetical protein